LILESTSEFQVSLAWATVVLRSQCGISDSRNSQAFDAEIQEIPILELTVVVFEGNSKRAPMRSAY
jgi:hypothetical protein